MRTTQASVKALDAMARGIGQPLPVVRYDLRDSSAAAHADWYLPPPSLVALSRQWLGRRLGLTGKALLEAEERIDISIVEQLEKGVPTTCGGFIVG